MDDRVTSEKLEHTGRMWVALTITTLGLIAIYFAGYFALGDHRRTSKTFPDGTVAVTHDRVFVNHVTRKAYYPLGWLEWKLSGQRVFLRTDASREPPDLFSKSLQD